MRSVSIILIAGAALLSGLIIWASLTAPFWSSFGQIIAMPWGIVTLVDLYLGFLCMACVIALFEDTKMKAFLWIVALLILGNVVSALWLAITGYARFKNVTSDEKCK